MNEGSEVAGPMRASLFFFMHHACGGSIDEEELKVHVVHVVFLNRRQLVRQVNGQF